MKKMQAKNAWRYYISLFRHQLIKLILTVLLSVVQVIPLLLIAWTFRHVIDVVIPQDSSFKIIQWAVAILLLSVFLFIINYFRDILSSKIVLAIITKVRHTVLQKTYQSSIAFHKNKGVASMLRLIIQDAEHIDSMTNAIILQFLPGVFGVLAFLLVLLYLSWQLCLVLVVLLPVGIFLYLYNTSFKASVKDYCDHIAGLRSCSLDALNRMELTRLQAATLLEIQAQTLRIDALNRASQRMFKLKNFSAQLYSLILTLISIILLFFGVLLVNFTHFTIGGLFSFFIILMLLKPYFMNVVVSIAQIIIGLFALDNLYSFLKHDDLSPYQGTTAVSKLTSVKFSNATFSYDDNLVLDNLNFSLPMQQTTAILGKNGSGKTSIIQLLCGFMKPQSGEVSVNDISYDQVNMASLRKQIGFVSQHPTIFNDTVFNNLTYGYEHVTMNDVRVVAQLINIDAFIQTLPMGYETNIGADGFKLSGGQRQTLAIVRALIAKPSLLVLDEPTNNLDQATIARLIDSLKNMNLTILIVTHHHSILSITDNIYHLESGALKNAFK